MAILLVVGLTLVSLALSALISWHGRKQDRLPLPPGPQGLPLLGNLNDLPAQGQPEFQHWFKHKQIYGPLSSVTVMGQTMIIIHDKQIAFELMEKRATNNSGRPKLKFGFDMLVHIQ